MTLTINNLFEATSLITHMEGHFGNESIIAREKQLYKGEIRSIPFLSGNALRHRMVRESGILYLLEALELKGKLSLDQLNFLMHGGVLYQSSPVSSAQIAEMYRTWPLLRLLGGALPGQILHGALMCGRGVLICKENSHYLELEYPQDYGSLLGAEAFVSKYQYTRGDSQRSLPEAINTEAQDTGLMIFSGQCLVKGSLFFNKLLCPNISELEVGALLLSLQLWQQSGGTIGGSAAKGHGKLALYSDWGGFDPEPLIEAYKAHVKSNKESAIAWLTASFKPKEKKVKK